MDPPGQRGKHVALDDDRERQIIDWIQQNAQQEIPVTKREIRDYCKTQLRTSIARGWINSFIHRPRGDVTQTQSSVQKKQRLQVPRVFLERPIQDLNEHI
jgi:hypothetical protein